MKHILIAGMVLAVTLVGSWSTNAQAAQAQKFLERSKVDTSALESLKQQLVFQECLVQLHQWYSITIVRTPNGTVYTWKDTPHNLEEAPGLADLQIVDAAHNVDVIYAIDREMHAKVVDSSMGIQPVQCETIPNCLSDIKLKSLQLGKTVYPALEFIDENDNLGWIKFFQRNMEEAILKNRLSGVAAIAAGNGFMLALKKDNTVWVRGSNNRGIYGDGKSENGTALEHYIPVQKFNDPDLRVASIAAGESHALALTSDGIVWAWGANESGQVGIGTNEATVLTPTKVTFSEPVKIVHISAALFSSLAIAKDGSLWMWGDNREGRLGIGNTDNQLRPVKVQIDGRVVAASLTGNKSVAVLSSGMPCIWGDGLSSPKCTYCRVLSKHNLCNHTPTEEEVSSCNRARDDIERKFNDR
jgi:hypothetical protein